MKKIKTYSATLFVAFVLFALTDLADELLNMDICARVAMVAIPAVLFIIHIVSELKGGYKESLLEKLTYKGFWLGGGSIIAIATTYLAVNLELVPQRPYLLNGVEYLAFSIILLGYMLFATIIFDTITAIVAAAKVKA